MPRFRALLLPVVRDNSLARANLVDAVFEEVAFVVGPALAALTCWVVGPCGVILVMALSTAASAWVAGGLPPTCSARARSTEGPFKVAGARNE